MGEFNKGSHNTAERCWACMHLGTDDHASDLDCSSTRRIKSDKKKTAINQKASRRASEWQSEWLTPYVSIKREQNEWASATALSLDLSIPVPIPIPIPISISITISNLYRYRYFISLSVSLCFFLFLSPPCFDFRRPAERSTKRLWGRR